MKRYIITSKDLSKLPEIDITVGYGRDSVTGGKYYYVYPSRKSNII